jgi:Kef-type K+ transport system membrane component KefB
MLRPLPMPFHLTSVFDEVAALLALASLVGIVGLVLRQPLVVSFIVVGVLSGPSALGIVESSEHVELLADIGVSVLLFLIGLKLDLQLVRSLGKVAVATGMGQVLFTSVVGFGICLALGVGLVPSVYVAVALTFSSTIIIVKLLSDKGEVDSLHGRIALGFLVVQDIVVVIAMVVLSAWGIGEAAEGGGPSALLVAGGAVGIVGIVFLMVRFASEPILRRLAAVPELLITFSIAWAIAFAAFSEAVGFGRELGGLAAGVSLASASYREAIASRLTSLRDFLLLFFFVGLGSRLDLGALGEQVGPGLVLSAFVLVGNPLIVMIIMRALGYPKRTGFLAGLTVAQISEFSFIFVAMGASLGHLGKEAVGLVTLVGLVTITASTYMIVHSHRLYARLERFLGVFDGRRAGEAKANSEEVATSEVDVIVFGLGRFGGGVSKRLHDLDLRVLGIDFDPEVVLARRADGLDAVYGDAADPDFAASLPLRSARCAVITISPVDLGVVGPDARIALVQALRTAGFAGHVAVRSHTERDHEALRSSGADTVLMPYEQAAQGAVDDLVKLFPERGPA